MEAIKSSTTFFSCSDVRSLSSSSATPSSVAKKSRTKDRTLPYTLLERRWSLMISLSRSWITKTSHHVRTFRHPPDANNAKCPHTQPTTAPHPRLRVASNQENHTKRTCASPIRAVSSTDTMLRCSHPCSQLHTCNPSGWDMAQEHACTRSCNARLANQHTVHPSSLPPPSALGPGPSSPSTNAWRG